MADLVVDFISGKPILANFPSSSGGAVDSVNSLTGAVVLDQDDIGDGTTYKQFSQTEKTKLSNLVEGTLTQPQVLARSLGC